MVQNEIGNVSIISLDESQFLIDLDSLNYKYFTWPSYECFGIEEIPVILIKPNNSSTNILYPIRTNTIDDLVYLLKN